MLSYSKKKNTEGLGEFNLEMTGKHIHSHQCSCKHIASNSFANALFLGYLTLGKGTIVLQGRSSINKKDSTTIRIQLCATEAERKLTECMAKRGKKIKAHKKQPPEMLAYGGMNSIPSCHYRRYFGLGVNLQITIVCRIIHLHMRMEETDRGGNRARVPSCELNMLRCNIDGDKTEFDGWMDGWMDG